MHSSRRALQSSHDHLFTPIFLFKFPSASSPPPKKFLKLFSFLSTY